MTDPLVPSWQFRSDGVVGDVVGGGQHGIQKTLTCRAWLCCRALDSLDDAIRLSEEWS